MIINDKIYGRYDIQDRVLVELMKSGPVQRLRGISQLGVPNGFYHLKGCSRFEHSVGVMLLLRKLGASLEEQAAGLLHDVSHTAFSHVVDWVVEGGDQTKENFQDQSHKKFFREGEVKSILAEYGFEPEKLADLKSFQLLDREIPELCADRIDYALIEFDLWANPGAVRKIISDLANVDGKIVFQKRETAEIFARTFLKCQTEHWGGYEAVGRYRLLALALKDALNKKIINFSDFDQNDRFIMDKLLKSGDEKILKILAVLRKKKLPLNRDARGIIMRKKFRYVDPFFYNQGELVRLSETSEDFKAFLERQRIANEKGMKVFLCES